ncbi:CLUMA_CG014721, isoform A [Clunio marinus]|uniref:CLUMA_CG014721, isoform A n=1 Tax=Clunio marinus TaxID=568069 RepID=A0A1J1ILT8_9DIPT|nr:CLUMA_CG014721, isoform A [Clunio marinus]
MRLRQQEINILSAITFIITLKHLLGIYFLFIITSKVFAKKPAQHPDKPPIVALLRYSVKRLHAQNNLIIELHNFTRKGRVNHFNGFIMELLKENEENNELNKRKNKDFFQTKQIKRKLEI